MSNIVSTHQGQTMAFELKPLTRQKKGQKLFGLLIALFWLAVILTVFWAIRYQNSQAVGKTQEKKLLKINDAQGQPQIKPNQPRLDEFLGSERMIEPNGNDQQAGNPTENTGSIEKLLEGKEIIIPEN